jgi:predicted Rdx family selenoprotein
MSLTEISHKKVVYCRWLNRREIMLERFMSLISKELELDQELQPSAPGVFLLPMDENNVIEISALPEGFYLRSTLANVLPANPEVFFTQMMQANLFYQATMGSTLGLNEDADKIVITRLVESDATYEEFHDALEDFMNSIDFWRQEALNQA